MLQARTDVAYSGDVEMRFWQAPYPRTYRLGRYIVEHNRYWGGLWQVTRGLSGGGSLACGHFTNAYDAFVAAELANDTERRMREGFFE